MLAMAARSVVDEAAVLSDSTCRAGTAEEWSRREWQLRRWAMNAGGGEREWCWRWLAYGALRSEPGMKTVCRLRPHAEWT